MIGKLDTLGRWGIGVAGSNQLTHHIYIPQGMPKIEHTNVASSDSGRMEDGIMRITWVRTDVRKVGLTYTALTGNELNYLRNLMQGKIYEFFYYDCGEVKHFTAYTGEHSYSAYLTCMYENEGGFYRDISINAVEL